MAPLVRERTTVDKAGERSGWEREYVFLTDCGTPMMLVWSGNRELLISYGSDSIGKAHVYREAFSKDGKVAISYKLDTEGSL